jgi:WD40 repeat protein
VADRLGLTLDVFMGVLKNPLAVEDGEVLRQSRPFGLVAAEILRRLGGEYEGLAQELELANRQEPLVNSGAAGENELSDTWNCVRSFSSGHTRAFTCVAFSPNGEYFVLGGYFTIQLWSLEEVREIWNSNRHSDRINNVVFSPDGKTIASVSQDGMICLMSLKGDLLWAVNSRGGSILLVEFSPDNELIASTNSDGIVEIWDMHGKKIRTINSGADNSVSAVSFDQKGENIIIGSLDGSLYSASLTEGIINLEPSINGSSITSISLHKEFAFIASAGKNGTIKLLDLNGTLVDILFDHKGAVLSVAYSPNGRILASGSMDRTIRLWDLEGNQVGHSLIGHSGSVNCVAFSPDGKIIVSCGSDAEIKLWSKYRTHQLPFRRLFDFVSYYLLDTCNNTDINFIHVNSPWHLPFDALIIPVSSTGDIEDFGNSFDEHINGMMVWQPNRLQYFIHYQMRRMGVKKIEILRPLTFRLPLEVSSNLLFPEILIICATVESNYEFGVDAANIATRAIINFAAHFRCKNLVLPLLGNRGFQLSTDKVANVMLKAITSVLKSLDDNEIEDITIVEKDPGSVAIIEMVCKQLFDNITSVNNTENRESYIPVPIAYLHYLVTAQKFPIQGNFMRIGRSNDNDLIVSERWVSLRHADIIYRNNSNESSGYYLRDFSRFGTLVKTTKDWQKIHHQELLLKSGMQLKFGSDQGQGVEFSIDSPLSQITTVK